jgi:predicted nuclease of predicted toxin-antitoxin system
VTIRFLADENIPYSVIRWLKSRGYDTGRTTDAPGAGASDLAIAGHAHRDKRLILTLDQDFVRLYRQAKRPFGVIVIRIHPPTSSKVEAALNRVLSTADLDKHAGSLILVSDVEIRIETRS